MIAHEVEDRNRAVNEVFNTLKKKGEKKYVFGTFFRDAGRGMVEATVDGVHFTDLGMMRYADLVCPVIRRFCKL